MPARPDPSSPRRRRFAVEGVVQGVGFRPFVFLLAHRYGLVGHVSNVSGGVRIEVQGDDQAIADFGRDLASQPPPLAVIESLHSEEIPCAEDREFRIAESDAQDDAVTPVSPDIALCDACRRELEDPQDRRYRYPFINCTDCGPRFTLITGLPYDRPLTTMFHFVMCPLCAAEYGDPTSRRFHAQPNACPVCGPHLWLVDPAEVGGEAPSREAAVTATRALLTAGKIVAIQGIGGFHLACDATREDAVLRLRQRKGRGEKPFALMVASLEIARRYAEIGAGEEALLVGRQRPIVLVARRKGILPVTAPPVAASVAPGQRSLGILLPYAPIHHLLLDERPLVMTSGNRSDEPICRDREEALDRLTGIADAFLLHDREIHVVCDDSVTRFDGEGELPIRRSRGYAPLPVSLPFIAPPLLAVGGEIKATLCLARDRRAFLSQHIGDMGNLETLRAFERACDHLRGLFQIEPRRVACDLHPDYLSTRWAEGWTGERGLPLVRVQHHHAHVAAVMAEHGLDGSTPVLGVALDGTGYGTDGTLWGCELLLADYRGFRRLAHLRPTPMPGGEGAIRNPGRMALAHLWAAGIDWAPTLPCSRGRSPRELRLLTLQLEKGLGAPLTSSAGRLFDAVAALLDLRQVASYEAQPAMELEALAAEVQTECENPYAFEIIDGDPLVLEPRPAFRQILADLELGRPHDRMAACFHAGVAGAFTELCRRFRQTTGIETVALTGGVFQNVILLRTLTTALRKDGFRVLRHRQVPPNDGGLALGQAAIAAFA